MPKIEGRTPKIVDNNPPNTYKVSRRSWSSWTLVGKHVFNKTFYTMMENQEVFHHPEFIKNGGALIDKHWKTVAWNAAYTAADVCSRGERHLLKDYLKGH